MLAQALGRILIKRRQQLRLSVRDLKKRSGVDISTISIYENARHKKAPRLDILLKLAIGLEMSLETLLYEHVLYVRDRLPEPPPLDVLAQEQ